MTAKRVLNIGQCGTDHHRISNCLQKQFGAEVTRAATEDEAVELLRAGSYDLVLVNRILDADGSSGLEVIGRICTSTNPPPVMLVSDFYASQQQAEAAGAVPGFGKGNLYDSETIQRLGKYLATNHSSDKNE